MQVGAAAFVRDEIKRHLPLFEFRKGHPYQYITTVYFDTEKLDFYRTAKSFYDNNLKIRLKEYYYQNGSSHGEPTNGLRNGTEAPHWLTLDTCFVEIKQRIQGLVVKRRFEVPKRLFGRFLAGEDVWAKLVEWRPGYEVSGVADIYQEFRWFVQNYQVIPKSIINYRRSVYQQDELTLRITFDDEIAVYPPVSGLYDSVGTLARNFLGVPRQVFEKVILEIKNKDLYPDWLISLLRTHQPKRLSKFTSSLRVLTHELPFLDSEDDTPRGEESGDDTTQISTIRF